MVSAKTRATQGTLLALLAAQHVAATSMELNPVTPGQVRVLDHRNPAFGGRPADDMVKPIVFEDPTLSRDEIYDAIAANNTDDAGNSTLSTGTRRRKLEVTSADVQKLEEYFQQPMIVNLNTIQAEYSQSEHKPAPWPSSYWPTYQDGINAKWDGNNASPAEKYAKAFGLNVKTFMNAVSASNGIDSMKDYVKSCKTESTCSRLNDGSTCAKRAGSSTGYCVQTWWGICHAWAPAAILEPEPRCNVVKNGVTFKPFDIKALLTEIYDGAYVPTIFTGTRYNGGDDSRDEYGRYNDATERDVGPGFFHIAVTNVMGRFQKSFIVDVNADAEVWNQPVRSYNIEKATVMTPEEAATTYFNVPKYPFNDDAVSIAYVKMKFSYIDEFFQDGPLVETGIVDQATASRDYTYVLELDADQNVIGGEWVGNSQTDHPDFLWIATGKPDADTVTAVGLSYKNVVEILEKSVACGGSPTPAPTTPQLTPAPTTPAPTTPAPTTPAPTTPKPTTPAPTTPNPTTPAPTTPAPTTPAPTTPAPTTPKPTTPAPTTPKPSTPAPTTPAPTTPVPTTPAPTTPAPTTPVPTTSTPTTPSPTTPAPTTPAPTNPATTTPAPTTPTPTTPTPTTPAPTTPAPTTPAPTTPAPTTPAPTTPASGIQCGNDQVGPQPCPNSEYCQPWDPNFYQCRKVPTMCGIQEVGVDYYGDDLATFQLLLPEQCCEKCANTAGCKAYTFVNYNADGKAYCYLKKGTGQKSKKTGAVSATIVPSTSLCATPAMGSCGNAAAGFSCCPSGSYCQPWDSNYYQCLPSPAKCSQQFPNTDFYGDDLATVYGIGPGECCEKCATTAGCKAYTFVNDNISNNVATPACYLKKGTSSVQTNPHAVSGLVN